MCMYMYMHMYVCMCIYIYIYICIYTYTYIYICSDEFTRLAETRLAQNMSNYIKIVSFVLN